MCCGGDYDDLLLDVDDSAFFFESDDAEFPAFVESDFVSEDELSDFDPESDVDSGFDELPFERLDPLRLSFL